jgi:glucan phosphorylase
VAWWATRDGNVFTTHTPVAAGFDAFAPELIRRYFREYVQQLDMSLDQVLALGRWNFHDANEPFNMAILAMRGSSAVNGVSRLHGAVSSRLFQPLFPRWPEPEVPVGAITNGVHMPSWDSAWAEAYRPEVGWALGDGREHPEPVWDAVEAAQLYDLLEQHIVPEFYDRDPQGIPVRRCCSRESGSQPPSWFLGGSLVGATMERLPLRRWMDHERLDPTPRTSRPGRGQRQSNLMRMLA